MILRNLRNSRRLLAIAFILAREDALFILDDLHISPLTAAVGKLFARRQKNQRKGQRLAAALERLGPAFIKLGQALSTRSDLIGDELADDLSDLRDRLPPFPTAVARATIEEELRAPLGNIFDGFDDTPIAAASIAQVHRAITKEGRIVAVKILRPGIKEAFAQDLDLFFWLAEIIEQRAPDARRLKPMEVVRIFKESVFFELDLRFEAAAATEMEANMERHETGFRIPSIDWKRTSRRVMTMQWVDGISLSDVEAIKASGIDPDSVLRKAAESLFSQVFRDGFFHADLHPGNLFVDRNGDLVAVDFGIMGRLDLKSRIYIAEILRGFLNEDYRHVAQVHFTAGYVPPGKSLDAFAQACMAVARPITGLPLNEISVARLLGQMFQIAAEFEMETQPQLLLLQKTMMVTEGVGRMLNPNLNMWELARPLIEQWAGEQFGPAGKIKEAARQGHEMLLRLPSVMQDIETALHNFGSLDGIRLHPLSIEALQFGRRESYRQILWLGWTSVTIFTLFAVAWFFR